MSDIIKTPLHDIHLAHGGNIVSFGGYYMPMHFGSITSEHEAVRSRAGLFDVSHMGQLLVSGNDSEMFLEKITTNNVGTLSVGDVQYTCMCDNNGGIIDDLLLFKLSLDKYMLIVNASNTLKDYSWIKSNLEGDVNLINDSLGSCILAIQGPSSRNILKKLTNVNLDKLNFYKFCIGKLCGHSSIISRTGYTGELGYELYVRQESVVDVWENIMKIGKELGIKPAGLGARDTLRMEMKYLLYGNDISQNTNPIEAGLGWITRLEKNDFIGKSALKKIQKLAKRKLVCIKMQERAIPRSGYPIYVKGLHVGNVTSGTMSPSLSCGIAIGYVNIEHSNLETALHIDIRGKRRSGLIVKPPFYSGGSLML
tara:strand:- start:23 stop:1123 length:1101 start_codon:yes stop_codon:yes gene_type:complete